MGMHIFAISLPKERLETKWYTHFELLPSFQGGSPDSALDEVTGLRRRRRGSRLGAGAPLEMERIRWRTPPPIAEAREVRLPPLLGQEEALPPPASHLDRSAALRLVLLLRSGNDTLPRMWASTTTCALSGPGCWVVSPSSTARMDTEA